MKRFDVELARFVSRLSFVGLSVLVLIYVYYALSPGNYAMLGICSGILAAGHGYAWIRSCCSRAEDPSDAPEEVSSDHRSE